MRTSQESDFAPRFGRILRLVAAEPALEILAVDLMVGDTISMPGRIPKIVTEPIRVTSGEVRFAYESVPGPGYEALPYDATLTVRRVQEAGH
jgi:hypothetical protein